jgi:exodeoxyribonuclease V beta subunit
MPLRGTQLIEASAGTGKTFSLASLYLRLLIEARLSVRDILVVTFTRAATRELRERIRQRLSDAARIVRSSPTTDAASAEEKFARAVVGACDEPRAEVAGRLRDAANRMDEATITTIHGFSRLATRENAFTSALPFDRGEQVDDNTVRDEFIGDFWRARALGAGAQPGFVDCWPSPDKLVEALKGLWDRPHAALAGPANDEIERTAQKARGIWKAERNAFHQLLERCSASNALRSQGPLRQTLTESGVDAIVAHLDARLESGRKVPLLPPWAATLTDPARFKNNAAELRDALIANAAARALAALEPLARVYALREARAAATRGTAERKRERRQFSYADMIAALNDAITAPDGGAALADALYRRWPVALVDEFQDTDPLQYDILRRIYQGRDDGGLILIGDPKQAIYGFRGGDVFAYLEATADAEAIHALDTNFRSTQGLVDAVETLFRAPAGNPFLIKGIGYPRVKAARGGAGGLARKQEPLAPLTIWPMALEGRNKGDAVRQCRAACTRTIAELLDPAGGARIHKRDPANGESAERPVRPGDIGILVNKNAEASDVQHQLSIMGIPAVCQHQSSIYRTPEASDIMQLLAACANPADEELIRAALTTDLIGKQLGDLIELTEDESRWRRTVDCFRHAHDTWREKGVLAILDSFIQDAAPRMLGWSDGARRMTNYLQLADLLSRAASETFGPRDLLSRLRRSIADAENGKPVGDDEQLRLENDQALVRITTVHKAKGLEYPIVFIPFAPWLGASANRHDQPHKPPLKLHDGNDRAVIDVAGSDETRAQAVTEARAEGLRLLYVALTRGQAACFLPWGAGKGSQNSALASLAHRGDGIQPDVWYGDTNSKPLTDALIAKRLQQLARSSADCIAIETPPGPTVHAAPPAPKEPPRGAARTDKPRQREPWSVHSFTSLARQADATQAPVRAEDEDSAPNQSTEAQDIAAPALPAGAAFGSAVHAVLEKADFAGWSAPDSPPTTREMETVASALRQFGVALPQEQTDTLLAQTGMTVANTLSAPLPNIGPLAAVAPENRRAEMEFMLRLGRAALADVHALLAQWGYGAALAPERHHELFAGLLHGYIDLVVEHANRYYIIDYKTNWLGNDAKAYEQPSLARAVREHDYDLQYLIYTTALHRYLRTRLDHYDAAYHLGGVRYLFMRGLSPQSGSSGIWCERPASTLIERLSDLLDKTESAA